MNYAISAVVSAAIAYVLLALYVIIRITWHARHTGVIRAYVSRFKRIPFVWQFWLLTAALFAGY